MAEPVERRSPDPRSPAVAPDDRGTEDVVFVSHDHKSVHLVGYPYCAHAARDAGRSLKDLSRGCLEILPPHCGVLLRPSCLAGEYRHLLFRGVCTRELDSFFGVEKDGLD